MLYNATGTAEHEEKINAAFSYYGPNGTISTVEHLTNVRMRHLAIIDWAGFKDLSRAVGGVPVYIPRRSTTPARRSSGRPAQQTLEGKKALAYVRTRYGLQNGDFDRIARQQNFLRAMMKKMLAKGTMRNPVKLTRTLSALTQNLTVDDEWNSGDMRAARAVAARHAGQGRHLPDRPGAGTETVPGLGSIVRLQPDKMTELFTAMKQGRMAAVHQEVPGRRPARRRRGLLT